MNKTQRLGVIDGLRAIAILMIVWFHIWQQSWLSSNVNFHGFNIYFDLIPRIGFLGVELLLFISGFGLFIPYVQKMIHKTPVSNLGVYAAKRFFRIAPSYYLNIFLLILLTQPFLNFKDGLWHTFTHIFFIHTFFPNSWGMINGVLWTVAIEVQFYIIFPLIAFFFTKKPFATFLIMVAIALVYRTSVESQYPANIYYYVNQLPAFFDFFAAGMFSCYIYYQTLAKITFPTWAKILATVISIGSFLGFLEILYWVDKLPAIPDAFSFWQAQNRQYLALLFIVLSLSSLFSIKYWQNFLSNKFFLFIAAISYNLFLWHQIIAFQLEKYHIPEYSTPDRHSDPVWQIQFTIVAFLLSILVATVLTYFFEKPIARWGLKKFS